MARLMEFHCQQRVGGDAVLDFSFPYLHSSLSPLFSSPMAANSGKGEKPQVSLGLQEGLGPGGLGARSRQRRGKDGRKALPLMDFFGAATWPTANGGHLPFSITSRGKRGISPSLNPLDRVMGARASSA
jgi:hypothetical protein